MKTVVIDAAFVHREARAAVRQFFAPLVWLWRVARSIAGER